MPATPKVWTQVANGTVKPDAANAACNVAMAMLKCVEVDFRLNDKGKI